MARSQSSRKRDRLTNAISMRTTPTAEQVIGRKAPPPRSRPGRDDGGHPLAFHRGVLLDLRHVFEGLQHLVHDLAAFVDVRELSAPEEDVDEDLVLVFEELAGPLDL